MSFRDQLLSALAYETRVIKHLATQIPAGGLDWRPTPQQRSTLELLRYLTYAALNGVALYGGGGSTIADAARERAGNLPPEEFAQAMDEQLAAMRRVLAGLTDEDLLTKSGVLPWENRETPLGEVLMLMGPQCMAAYRMQLFLHAKGAGSSGLDSGDCWGGVSTGEEV